MKQGRAKRMVMPIYNIHDGYKVQLKNKYVLLNLIGQEPEEKKNWDGGQKKH